MSEHRRRIRIRPGRDRAPGIEATAASDTLRRLISCAVAELLEEIEEGAPAVGAAFREWATALPGTGRAVDLFTSRWRFPVFLLPWWAEHSVRADVDLRFQEALVRSSVAGYYYIRLVDDVMDRHGASPALLAAAGPLFSAAQQAYAPSFPPQHPFWSVFRSALLESAEATYRDAVLGDGAVNQTVFQEVAARKIAGAKIPLSAAVLRCDRPDLLPQWHRVCDLLGRHEQLLDDLVDSLRDLPGGQRTWILAEAHRRSASADEAVTWLLADGARWALEHLARWRDEIGALARSLACPELDAFLAARAVSLEAWYADCGHALAGLSRVGRAMTPAASQPELPSLRSIPWP